MRMATALCVMMSACTALLLGGAAWAEDTHSKSEAVLIIQGQVQDETGSPIGDARVKVFHDGHPFQGEMNAAQGAGGHGDSGGRGPAVTASNGLYMIWVKSNPDRITDGNWAVKVSKPSFKSTELIPLTNPAESGVDSHGLRQYNASVSLTLKRFQGIAFWLALAVLVGIYVLISFELVHRTLAAFLGAGVILLITHTLGHFDSSFQILTFEQALHAVDWNVIFLLMGMMIIVGVLKESGVFQWMAYKAFQYSGGRIFVLSAVLCLVTAVLSAFLDNVTTMLLLTPVTIEIALVLGISPFAFLIPEIMASNFGGTATLIGDPPNIMIGSYAGLTFNDFVITLTPPVIVALAAQILYTKWYYGRDYEKAKVDDVPEMISFLKEKYQITNYTILASGGAVLAGVVMLFILHGMFHMQVSVAALFGGATILLVSRVDIVEILERDIEWPSLIFFIMLFIVVGGAEETGILQYIADWLMKLCANNLILAVLLIMWTSAILSAIVDNIPFTATMLPVVAFLSKTIPGAESGVLWWALALGACFGGNATIIGASANVITIGIAERAGHKITFLDFIKHGTPITIVGLIIASAYLMLIL